MFPTDYYPQIFPYWPDNFLPDESGEVAAIPIAVTVYGPQPFATIYGPTPDPDIPGT